MTSQAQVIKTRLPNPPPPAEVLLQTVHAAVEELKAKDIVEIDVRGKSSVTDFMVIASGTSTRAYVSAWRKFSCGRAARMKR